MLRTIYNAVFQAHTNNRKPIISSSKLNTMRGTIATLALLVATHQIITASAIETTFEHSFDGGHHFSTVGTVDLSAEVLPIHLHSPFYLAIVQSTHSHTHSHTHTHLHRLPHRCLPPTAKPSLPMASSPKLQPPALCTTSVYTPPLQPPRSWLRFPLDAGPPLDP